jgi:hypothetical protein
VLLEAVEVHRDVVLARARRAVHLTAQAAVVRLARLERRLAVLASDRGSMTKHETTGTQSAALTCCRRSP